MDYFSALTVFHSVADTGSFSAAAKQLGLAVSSVTRQIDSLEAALNTPLFHRSTRKLTLTGAGSLYLQHSRTALDDLTYANQLVKQEIEQPQGTLRMTFAHSYGSHILAPLLAEFAECYPKISLEIYGSDRYVDVQAERFDLAVRLGQVNDPNLVARKVGTMPRLLCATPDYLNRHGMPLHPNDLVNHNCLLYSYRNTTQSWFFRKDGIAPFEVKVGGSLHGNNTEILLAYAMRGLGIAHLPDWLVTEPLTNGSLISLLPDWHITPTSGTENDGIYLVYSSTSRQIVKINLLVDFLQEKLQAVHFAELFAK